MLRRAGRAAWLALGAVLSLLMLGACTPRAAVLAPMAYAPHPAPGPVSPPKYFLYVPPELPPGPVRVLLALHGMGGNGSEFAKPFLPLAQAHGWILAAPTFGYGDWQIMLPNAALTLVQIGIGIADLTIGALAMYTLLPGEPAIDFSVLLVTFVLATLIGFLSHAPGSLGVFDAAMLVGLAQLDKNELLASLLIFRILYFILPFFVALCVLSARELWMNLDRRADARSREPPPA